MGKEGGQREGERGKRRWVRGRGEGGREVGKREGVGVRSACIAT